MKKLQILICLIILAANSLSAQNVNIPDAIFKMVLVADPTINTNGDGEIQVSEAAAFTGTMFARGENIASLVGIEAFTALTVLYCNDNLLTTLDVSANTALTELYCEHNQLATLDVSANTALTVLSCIFNQLTILDVSANTALTELYCTYNQLTTLDVSANTALTILDCNATQLTTLNVKNGNNSNMADANFSITNNPNLLCIEVDDVAYSYANWTQKDATASYSTDCSTFTSTSTLSNETTNITTYPNPTNGSLTINLEKTYQNATIQVRNTIGQTVFSNTYNGVNQIDLDLKGAAGVYFVSVRTEQGEAVIKVVKE